MVEVKTFFLLLALPMTVNAAIPGLPRTSGEIVVDGILDEGTWKDALRVELEYETSPGENTAAPVETVAFLAEDGQNLYIAFRASDPNPSQIRAWLRDRDSLSSNDFVGVSFDTYDDGRRAFEFYSNPLGVQLDKTHDDVNKNDDKAWDAIWESAAKIGDSGYVVEMRIPLNQLRFQDTDGEQTWAYHLVRSYPRERQIVVSNNAKDRNRNCNICQYSKFRGLDGSSPSNNLEIVPTLTASQVQVSDDPGVLPLVRNKAKANAGVTIRYGITPELTANIAISPDFSQVESDRVQLDVNNRFSSSFPEKRPFFLDGADYFSTPMQAIFTRSVANPEFAAKLTGKRGANTIATFVAQDEVTNLLFPSATGSETVALEQTNTAFVGRYSRSVGDTSALGALLTVRDGSDYQNIVGGFDTRWRINDNNELVAQVLISETEYPFDVATEYDQPFGKFGGEAVLLQYGFDTRDWFANVDHWQIDSDFRADAGFMKQAGNEQQEFTVGRKWHGDESSWWSRMKLRTAYEIKHRGDGQLLEDNYIASFELHGALQSSFRLYARSGREFSDGVVFDVERLEFSSQIEPIGGLRMGISAEIGSNVDVANNRLADQQRIKPSIHWNINRHLMLNISGVLATLDTKDGKSIFEASVLDARLTWQFDLRSFLRVTVQRKDVDRNPAEYIEPVDSQNSDVGRQLLYSFKVNPQTVFFLGYSDSYIDNDQIDRLVAADRSWFMKVGYAWSL